MTIIFRRVIEIMETDVERLEAHELRELVGRLLQAELRKAGYSDDWVRWNGNRDPSQDESYVHISLPPGAPKIGPCWTREAIFDCRVLVETAGEIYDAFHLERTRTLRPALAELFSQGGAYFLVSAQGTTEPFLVHCNRKAMRRAIDLDGPVALDFFDRAQLLTWIQTQPTVALWLKQLIQSKGEPVLTEVALYQLRRTPELFRWAPPELSGLRKVKKP